MRTWLAALLAVILMATMAMAAEPTPAPTSEWEGGFLAAQDLIEGRLMYDGGGRAKIGVDLAWLDEASTQTGAAWRIGFAATYDLMQRQDFKAWLIEVPATLYIGGLGGVLVPDGGSTDATAALMTGFVFGSEQVKLGIEYQYLLTRDLWKELAQIDDNDRVLFYAAFRF